MDETNDKLRHITPGMALPTVQLIERLKAGKPGDTLTDEQLEDACGHDTRPSGKGYTYLMSAIRHCRRNFGVNWQRIPRGDSIRCLVPGETVESVERIQRGQYKRSGVALQMLRNVNGEVDDETKVKVNLAIAQFGFMRACASSDMTKRMAARTLPDNPKPDMRKMLEAFK